MTTFATAYSGIGGADCGFVVHGWQPTWQAECDPWRRRVLTRGFGVPIYGDVRWLAGAPPVDVLFAELPDSRIGLWWPAVWQARRSAREWLVCECSPTVRCDDVLRDLALGGWAFRYVLTRSTIAVPNLAPSEYDCRSRAFVLASPSAARVDAVGLAASSVDITTHGVGANHARFSPRWHEASRGLRQDWTCACGCDPCSCNPAHRIAAVNDATSPYLSHWLAELLDGQWKDDRSRGVTAAAGQQ